MSPMPSRRRERALAAYSSQPRQAIAQLRNANGSLAGISHALLNFVRRKCAGEDFPSCRPMLSLNDSTAECLLNNLPVQIHSRSRNFPNERTFHHANIYTRTTTTNPPTLQPSFLGRAQEIPEEEPRRAQETPEDARRAQESPGEPTRAQETPE
jgi:hypothetical protein